MKFQLATLTDIAVIQDIANKTWPVAYKDILSNEQLDYMLGLFYSEIALSETIKKNSERFFIAKTDEETIVGFFSIQHFYELEKKSKLHKIYILPEFHGKGYGKLIIDECLLQIKKLNFDIERLFLNVNRSNKALHFYEKLGFEIIETVDIEIGNGYLMEDFVLELRI